ncbi:MAG: CbiX/SirB N-terminal domain-containing protein [Thiothrix sp.]|nr:CbiX/SirB N-terminal domain-containing protein [Thiothrix sp.]HPQ94395.1 CbiX/SirB N-terminal domain-containing protein [Thiolinea sp.]
MKSLLLVAHGSRRPASNEEIRSLTRQVAARSGTAFGHVDCAFLELAEPSIGAGIEAGIAAGATEIVVFPCFLSAGRHVVQDVPDQVAAKQREHPDVVLRIGSHLGASTVLPELILATVAQGFCVCGRVRAQCRFPHCRPVDGN